MRTRGRFFATTVPVMLLVLGATLAAPSGPSARGVQKDEDAATAPGPDKRMTAEDELADALRGMTPEQVEALIQRALKRRLETERRQVAVEIKRGLLYDPEDIDAALALLENEPANTQADNVDRICLALAKADTRLSRPYALFRAGKHAEAAEAVKETFNLRELTYLSAAKHYIYAESLAMTGQDEQAVEAYNHIVSDMPDRISFAAAAAVRVAETYEKMGRFLYAMRAYTYCLRNYGLTLDNTRFQQMLKKVEEYALIYEDPLGNLAQKMAAVQRRLEAQDSGKETQRRENEIVALLEDLIKTAEESQGGSSAGSSQQRQKQERPPGSQGRSASAGGATPGG